MTQPLTAAQQAAALYQQQMGAWQPPPDVGDAGSAQAVAASRGPAPAAAAPPAPIFDPSAINALYQAGKISREQYAAMGGQLAPNAQTPIAAPVAQQVAVAPSAIPQPDAGPKKKPNLVVAGQGGAAAGAPGVANAQPEGQSTAASSLKDVLSLPSGEGLHRVGFSPADKNMLGSLNEQGQVEQTDAAKSANAVQQIATTFAGQNDALAAQSQQGLADYQKAQNDNAIRRKQIDDDAVAAQRRIEGKMADLEASGVDPNRYFQNQSTGQNILGALAIGLGSFASHALGPNGHDSTNTALDIINGAIARDVDAQKANLQKSLSVMSSRMNLNAQGFDQQKSLLEAERESIQSGYAVALNEVAKRQALFKDSADVQTSAAKITAGLQAAANDKVGQLNQQIYGLQKGSERVVGGTDTVLARLNRAVAIKERLDKLDPNSVDAQKAGAEVEKIKADAVKSTAEAAKASLPNGGKPMNAHAARRMSELDAQDADAQELDRIVSSGSTLSPSDRAKATAIAENLRNGGHKSVPEHPLDLGNWGARRAGIQAIRQSIQREKASLLAHAGGGGGGAETDDSNPADLEREEGDQ